MQPTLSPISYKLIAIGFIIAVIFLAIVIVNSAFSRAIITVTAKADKTTYSTEISVGMPDAVSPNAQLAKEAVVEATASEAKEFLPQAQGDPIPVKVKGVVTFINESNQSQPLLKKTQLQSETGGMIYRTEEAVTVPPKGEVTAQVIADKEGSEGEITAPTKLAIIKLNANRQKEVYAEARKDFSKGETVKANLSENDILTAKDELTPILKEQIRKKLEGITGFTLKDDQIQYDEIKIITTPQVGAEITSFQATGSLAGRTALVKLEDIIKQVKDQYYGTLPAGYSLLGFNDNTISWYLQSVSEDKKSAKISASIEVFTTLTPNANIMEPAELFGLNANVIKSRLLENKNISTVKVSFWPFWRRTAPKNEKRIIIKILEDTTAPAPETAE